MNRHSGRRGAALIIAVVVVLIMVGLATGFVILSAAQSTGTTNNVTRIQTFYIAEAGLNQAIDEARTGQDTAGDGIGVITNGVYGGGTFSCTATLVDGPSETPVGPGTPVPGVNQNELRLTCTATYQNVVRRVEVVLSLDTGNIFENGLFGDEFLDITGTVVTDSYDSSIGTYASQATNVDGDGNSFASENGDIGSNGGVSVGGTSFIHGDAVAGPGNSTTLGVNAEVSGSTSPATSPTPLPSVTYAPPPILATTFNETGKASTIAFPAGDYHFSTFSLGGGKVVSITGEVTIYVDGDFSIGGTAAIEIEPGAKLTIKQGPGGTVDVDVFGTGFVNKDQLPTSLLIESASSGQVSLRGTADFYGAIYAPDADILMNGTSDTFGALIGNSVTTVGTSDFHYDEALGLLGGGAPTYDLVSWQELPPP